MNLLPGFRFAIAAKFNLEPVWTGRLRVGAGTEDHDGRFFPRGSWAEPSLAALALLTGSTRESYALSLPLLEYDAPSASAEGTSADDPDAITLFKLPEHLRSAWWDLLAAATESGGPLRGFDEFAARVVEFLRFKQLDIPAGTRLEAIVTAAGERSVQRDTGAPAGLGPSSAGGSGGQGLWGIVNLGDEDSAVVLLNLPFATLATELARTEPSAPALASMGELAVRFFRAFPNYPLVRLRLASGEGCRLPASGLVLDGDPSAKADPDTLLLIYGDGSAAR